MVTALLNAILISSYQVDKRHIKRPTPWWLVIPVGRWSRRIPRIGHPLPSTDVLLYLFKIFFRMVRMFVKLHNNLFYSEFNKKKLE